MAGTVAVNHGDRGRETNGGLAELDVENGYSKREGLVRNLSAGQVGANMVPSERGSAGTRSSGSVSSAERDIRKLLEIEGLEENKLRKVAKETWEAKDKMLTARIESKETRTQSLKNEIYQLLGFFVVFQRVLLSAVTTSTVLHCNNVGWMLALSALASVVTVAGVAQKFSIVRSLDKEMHVENAIRRINFRFLSSLLALWNEFEFSKHAKDAEAVAPICLVQLWYGAVLVDLALTIFSGLFLASIHQVKCNP